MIRAEEQKSLEVLKGSGGPRTGVMVHPIAPLLTARDGCSKALTVCTALQGGEREERGERERRERAGKRERGGEREGEGEREREREEREKEREKRSR